MANISLNLSEIENSGLLQRYYANILQGSCYLQRQSDAKKYLNNNTELPQLISSPAVDMFMLQTSVGENLICAGSPALGASMCRAAITISYSPYADMRAMFGNVQDRIL